MANTYPSPIISTKPGSWAHSTVKERLPEIARRVMDENQFSPQINDQLIRLREEIPDHPIRNLLDEGAPDYKIWQGYIKPYLGKKWLAVPWFFSETYFYRRIMEAVDYFNLKQDPFGYQKKQGLEKTGEDIADLAGFLTERLGILKKRRIHCGMDFIFPCGGIRQTYLSGRLAVNGILATIPERRCVNISWLMISNRF